MPEITGYTPSTTWETVWDEELEEIQAARAARLAAIAAGEEPKTWPVSGPEGNEWPDDAWVHEEGVRA